MNNLLYEELTYKIIGSGQEVYKELGPGYLKKQQTYIEVENLSKKYTIGKKEAHGSLREEIMQAITAPFKRGKPSSFGKMHGLDNSIKEGIKYHL